MQRVLFLFFLLSSISPVFSQEQILPDDTIKVEFSTYSNILNFSKLNYYDSQGFQQYRPFRRGRLPWARSGNLGLPTHSFNIDVQGWNTNHHLGGYQPYLFVKDSIRYYRTTRPFTELSYTNGSEKEQLFQVIHTQNIGKGLNISVEYQRIVSEGFYIQQLTNHTQFNASFNLSNRNNKFHSRGYYLINSLEAQENGGVILSRNEDQEDNTVLLDINLRNTQNQIRSNGVGAKNDYDLLADSNSVLLNLSHEINWTKSYRKYQDDTTGSNGFYENFFYDEVESADSSFAQVVENELKINLLDKQINIGLNNSQYHYFQNSFIDENFSSNFLIAELYQELFNQRISVTLKKGISGFYKDNLDLKAKVYFKEIDGILPSLLVRNTNRQGDFLLLNQRSNHFSFRENFETSNASTFQLKLRKDKWKLELKLGYIQLDNYIYYDSLRRLAQVEKSIGSFYTELRKKFSFLKHLNLQNWIRFQSNSGEEFIPLPSLYSYHSFYYENLFFKKALFFQVGADLYYVSAYNGYAYDPSLSQFYNGTRSGELGDFFQLDVFVNMRISKSARIFAKGENILNNSFSEETTRIQEFPIPGRAIKVGLSWRLIN